MEFPHHILDKAQHYCSYQERCRSEMAHKLKLWQTPANFIQVIIQKLVEEDFINETRYAEQYVSGKFRNNKWGRIKIRHALKLKQITAVDIEKGLLGLNEEEYRSCLESILKKKSILLKENDPYKRKSKLLKFAAGKGFEYNLIMDILQNEGS